MALQSNIKARERILVVGSYKVGKSKTWLDIVRWIIKTKSDSKVYVLDTDDSVEMMVQGIEGVEDVLTWSVPGDWEELIAHTIKYQMLVKPDDWLVVDMINYPWEFAQGYYTEQIHSKSIDQWFFDQKKQDPTGNTGGKFAGNRGENWGIINKLYRGWVVPMLKTPCHKLACAPAERLADEDDKETRDLFGRFGAKPGGQKALGHQFHSVLLLSKRGKEEYRIQTIGEHDPDREVLDKEIGDFVTGYLLPTGGWSV